jgi:PilZ domain
VEEELEPPAQCGATDYRSNRYGLQKCLNDFFFDTTRRWNASNRIYNATIGHNKMESPGTRVNKGRERKFPRVKVSLPAEAKHVLENYPRRGQTANLSEGGCYIEMVQTLEPPTCVDVVLWLNDEKIMARAEVVSRHAHLGNGIRFIRMSDSDKEKLRAFLELAQKTSGPLRGLGPHAPRPD